MALQKNITLDGGIVANNCYVRIYSVEADKRNEDSDWSLKILVNVYKDSSIRDHKTNEYTALITKRHLHSDVNNREYKFSYDPESEQGDLIALAYDKLKTHEDFSGASDV